MNLIKNKIYSLLLILFSCIFILFFDTNAALVNTADNVVFKQHTISTGVTGKEMTISFDFTADKDYNKAFIGLAYDEDLNSTPEEEKYNVNTYPFETSKDTFERKDVGKLKMGQTKRVSLNAKVRKDISEGYYSILVYVADSKEGGSKSEQEYINVWIKRSSTDKDNKKEENKNVNFILGKSQETPRGKYPNIMNFSINLQNTGKITAQDVLVSMVLDKDPNIFPFEINEINYDRKFESIASNETVSLDYSFAIRKDVYTGYYPVKIKIRYKESSNSEVKIEEKEFFVNIINKEKENKSEGDFNVNNRKKARLIVDSFYTNPKNVLAGQEFELVLNMKNASTNISANNILFSFESEKVSESPIFSIENGASSKVINSLAPNQSTEIRLKMISQASIEQRSYTLKINQKFDTEEFKNAEENVSINIPIYQIAKLKLGTFDLIPSEISVGEELNLTFPINNTGKVKLYNVSAKFESDYFKNNELYIGNIKPGESANVDMMLSATDFNEEKASKIVISYEDDSGKVSTFEKEILIPVNEKEILNDDFGFDNQNNDISKNKSSAILILSLIIISIIIILIILVFTIKKIKSKKNNGVR